MEQNYEDSRKMIDALQERRNTRIDKEMENAEETLKRDSSKNPVLYHQVTQDNVAAAMKLLFKELNYMGSENEFIDEVLANTLAEHRTIQQCFIGGMFKILSLYAQAPHDLRNEDSVRVCRKMVEAMKDDLYFRFV